MLHRFKIIVLFSLVGVTQQPVAQDQVDEHQDLFVAANVLFTLCHELTHALITTFDVPVLGHEEDAADQIATLCFLYPDDEGRRDPMAVDKLVAVADAWRLEWELDKNAGDTAFWDEHALDIQRYYHVLCALYGSDPQRFEDLPDKLELPWQRAWSCADYEYIRIAKAGRWLLDTYGVTPDGSASHTTGQVHVKYADSGENKLQAQGMLRQTGLFERKAEMMNSMFNLPHDIAIVGADCLGDQTAYWNEERREVVFCYDLVERFVHLSDIRQCILGRDLGLAERKPMESAQIQKCVSDIH